MNNHDELSYIKIITKIIETMTAEQDAMKRELMFHRVVIILQFIILIVVIGLSTKGVL